MENLVQTTMKAAKEHFPRDPLKLCALSQFNKLLGNILKHPNFVLKVNGMQV